MSIGEVYHAARARNINVSHTLKLRYVYSGNQLEPETQALLSFTFVLTCYFSMIIFEDNFFFLFSILVTTYEQVRTKKNNKTLS